MGKKLFINNNKVIGFEQNNININKFLYACKGNLYCDAKIKFAFLKYYYKFNPETKNKVLEILSQYRNKIYDEYCNK